MASNDVQSSNAAIQAQFSKQATKYESSPVHARGEDLQWIVEAASLNGSERVLDVATGTGHTAMALAAGARTVVGVDLTARMVESATSLTEERGLQNVQFVVSDVVQMPFPSSYFDLVACRLAAHHFADSDAGIAEISRVLKPGGRFILVDHIAPEEPALDRFINRIDWLRDGSHVREWTVSEWIEKCNRVGIEARLDRSWHLNMSFSWWIQQAAPAADRRDEIRRMMQEADQETKQAFQLQFDDDGEPVEFALQCVLIKGTKSK